MYLYVTKEFLRMCTLTSAPLLHNHKIYIIKTNKRQANLPEQASSRSSLLMSQSSEPENWAQFFLFPLMSAARKMKISGEKWHDIKRCNNSNIGNCEIICSYWAHLSLSSDPFLNESMSHLSSLKITWLSSALKCGFTWVELQCELLHLSVCLFTQ